MNLRSVLMSILLTGLISADTGCEYLTVITPTSFSYDDTSPGPGCQGSIGMVLLNDTDTWCYYNPGIYLSAISDYISFFNEGSCGDITCFDSWWYAMDGHWSYRTIIDFQISADAPANAEILFEATAVNPNCDPECPPDSEPWICIPCPLTDPIQFGFTLGEPYPNRMGDANLDSTPDVLDLVGVISNIVSGYYESEDFYREEEMGSFFADMNQNWAVDILDVILITEVILRN